MVHQPTNPPTHPRVKRQRLCWRRRLTGLAPTHGRTSNGKKDHGDATHFRFQAQDQGLRMVPEFPSGPDRSIDPTPTDRSGWRRADGRSAGWIFFVGGKRDVNCDCVFGGLKDEACVFLLQVVRVGIRQDNLSYKNCNCKYTHLDPALPVPNGWVSGCRLTTPQSWNTTHWRVLVNMHWTPWTFCTHKALMTKTEKKKQICKYNSLSGSSTKSWNVSVFINHIYNLDLLTEYLAAYHLKLYQRWWENSDEKLQYLF